MKVLQAAMHAVDCASDALRLHLIVPPRSSLLASIARSHAVDPEVLRSHIYERSLSVALGAALNAVELEEFMGT